MAERVGLIGRREVGGAGRTEDLGLSTERPAVGTELQRDGIDIEIRALAGESGVYELSFSSEAPVFTCWGTEILSHDDGCIDFNRINSIGVLLWNHDRDVVIGSVLSAWVDPETRKCKAKVRFDDDAKSQEIKAKVDSGTLRGVSFGYRVTVYEEIGPNAKSSNGRFTGPCDVGTRWEPYEISICSVPADATVGLNGSDGARAGQVSGVGDRVSGDGHDGTDELGGTSGDRGLDVGAVAPEGDDEMRLGVREGGAGVNVQAPPVADEQRQAAAPVVDERAAEERTRGAERQRVMDITTLCREFSVEQDAVDGFVRDGQTVDQVRAAVLDIMRQRNAPTQTSQRVDVTADAEDKLRAAAVDGMMLRAGFDAPQILDARAARMRTVRVERLAPGADEFRGMSLRSLAEECLRAQGVHNAARLSHDELLQRVLTPDSAFTAITNQIAGASMMIGHQTAETTYQMWTGRDSLNNFKATPQFRISEVAQPLEVKQNGEVKRNDPASDESVSAQLHTYGQIWGFTRTSMINDDLSVLTRMPAAYARAHRRLINKTVYAYLNVKPAIYDGIAIFEAGTHKNIATGGDVGKPTVATLDAGRVAMKSHKDISGQAKLNINPGYIIVGIGIETVTAQLLRSMADPAGTHAGVNNPFEGFLPIISDAEIDDSLEWFLAANPATIDTISVFYLNGQEAPELATRLGFEVLGMEFRMVGDFGVQCLDYRGLYHNPGH